MARTAISQHDSALGRWTRAFYFPDPPLADIPGGLSALSHFSARWQGTLTAPEDGEYELGLEGDDGCRLTIDGKTVIDDRTKGAARYRQTFENNIHLSRAYKDALGERISKIRERYGLASGMIEYRPELWAEEEQLDLFPLE